MEQPGRRRFRRFAAAFMVAAVACVIAAPASAQAGHGLVAESGDWLWPRLQARITVHTATLAPVGLTRAVDTGGAATRSVQGGAVLGDYVFATPAFGSFRATSGLMLGAPGGAPMGSAAPSARLGLTLLDLGYQAGGNGQAEAASTVPYLGLGYSSDSLWRSLSVSADVGLVAGRPAGLGQLGRAMLGSQGTDAALRDLRLAPVLQLGVRYSF